MAGYSSIEPITGTRLAVATAVQCANGILGSTVGTAYDTVLFGIYIPANGTAGAVTIGGMYDSAGNPQNLPITGQVSSDYFWLPPSPMLNFKAPFVFTASIANLIWVFTRPYIGPERPNTQAVL